MTALDSVIAMVTVAIWAFFVSLLSRAVFSEHNWAGKITIAFTGGTVAAWTAYLLVWWWNLYDTGSEVGVLDKAGSITVYTPRALTLSFTLTAGAVLGAGLIALGILKAYELLRSPKTDEKKE